MAKGSKFKRLVLEVPHHATSSHGMRFGAELARLLELDLLGLFVKQERILDLAALPFIREFRPLDGGWRQLDFDQLSRDLEIAARTAERAFTQAARTLSTACQFEVVQGSTIDTIAAVARAGDIILLVEEPASSAAVASPQLLAMLDAAFHSLAAVLLAPMRIARQAGTIVAIATEPDDASIDIASAIAGAAKEDLIVIETFVPRDENAAYQARLPAGIRGKRVSVTRDRNQPLDPLLVTSALRHVKERLLVMTRGDDAVASMIAAIRHVPILIVEPQRNDEAAAA